MVSRSATESARCLFDGFTPSGTRRYLPNTLENASKMMKTAGRNRRATGMGISFHSNFAAGLLDSLGSLLKDIRARKGSLTTNHEEVDAFRDRWSQVFFDLGEKCQPDAEGYDDYGAVPPGGGGAETRSAVLI